MWRTLLIAIICLGMANHAGAHSGRTNAQGCHNDRKNGGYHCHGGSAQPTSTVSKTSQSLTVAPSDYVRTTTSEDFYVCVQEVQNLAQTYSATVLSNTSEQYRVQLDLEDGPQITTCLATHQKVVEQRK